MDNEGILVASFLNQAILEAQLDKAKNYSTHLCVAKLDLKFDLQKPELFKEVIGFIHSFLDFTPMIPEGRNSFLLFLHDTKLHTAVMTMKNLVMSIKIKYGIEIKGVGVTDYSEDEDSLLDIIERVHSLYMKSKVSQRKDIFYATRYFDYGSSGESFQAIFVKEPKINLYGFYKEAPLVHEAEILEFVDNYVKIRSNKEYLSFLKREEFVYLEHKMIPDVMRADIVSIDLAHSVVELNSIKFMDNSPVHRKNIRVAPHKPVQALLAFEEEIQIEGLVSDISKNSILFTTQLAKIEELQIKELQNKKFQLTFHLENSSHAMHSIDVRAMVYKIFGNQMVLNIYPSPEVQTEIAEYISLCQSLLLLELQGKAL